MTRQPAQQRSDPGVSSGAEVLGEYRLGSVIIRPKVNLELTNGNFMRVMSITRSSETAELSLKGWVFCRVSTAAGLFERVRNELYWLIRTSRNDERPISEQALESIPMDMVLRRRRIKLTNQPTVSCAAGVLVCRMKFLCFDHDRGDRALQENKLPSDGALVRLQEHECDIDCGISDEVLRQWVIGEVIKGGSGLRMPAAEEAHRRREQETARMAHLMRSPNNAQSSICRGESLSRPIEIGDCCNITRPGWISNSGGDDRRSGNSSKSVCHIDLAGYKRRRIFRSDDSEREVIFTLPKPRPASPCPSASTLVDDDGSEPDAIEIDDGSEPDVIQIDDCSEPDVIQIDDDEDIVIDPPPTGEPNLPRLDQLWSRHPFQIHAGYGRVSDSHPRSRRYTFGDLFCGCGGASRGATMAGLRVQWAVDREEPMRRSYTRSFPTTRFACVDVFNFVTEKQYEDCRVDILHLSPPCQFFSPAHTTPGAGDEENTAASFVIDHILKNAKPRIATLENTSGLLERHPDYFRTVIRQFTSSGYNVRWKVVNLADYGVPQSRRRLLIIASA
jgi:hypothetical protein